jgi:hypothetical protein
MSFIKKKKPGRAALERKEKALREKASLQPQQQQQQPLSPTTESGQQSPNNHSDSPFSPNPETTPNPNLSSSTPKEFHSPNSINSVHSTTSTNSTNSQTSNKSNSQKVCSPPSSPSSPPSPSCFQRSDLNCVWIG